ncbi:PadR family transcriptional regulator [Acinetobacter sp. B51(2017)]|uniref:PadR family transcriptional regulator n=1 Tax=Acinetobacter sp. B51(2017) TaxID=2060938 RepID=UPI000F07C8FB|nr:PadR family transcriptional regulator [Acinetobacter sp. B51(2017)]
MSLAHVLITSLLEKPSSGIELARRFDHSMGYFWSATHQQIYRELKNMLQQGWISTQSPPDLKQKIYQVEAKGRAALATWMLEHSAPAQLREDLMVRLRAEAQLNSQALIPELQKHLIEHQKRLRTYQAIFAKDFAAASPDNRQQYIQKMILQLGLDLEQDWVNWLEQLIQGLQQYQDNKDAD